MRSVTISLVLLFAQVAMAARVVIDAGHGGSNTGAAGPRAGVYEKQVTLAVARRLGAVLRARGVAVVMTRQHDRYVTLRERVRRAEAARPDCFISLHANASSHRGRRGIETYILAAPDAAVEARRAASRVADPVAALLTELRLLDAHRRSVALAAAVQARLVAATGDVDRGLRQAPFDVLAGQTTPAVLVELGFLDHPIEGEALLQPAVQQRLAEAIADGVMDFLQRSRESQNLVGSAPPRP